MKWWEKILTIGITPPPPPPPEPEPIPEPLPPDADPKLHWEIGVPKFCKVCGSQPLIKKYSEFDEQTGEEKIQYVAAQCPNYKDWEPQHTSQQWHVGNGWYGSPNKGFKGYYKHPSLGLQDIYGTASYTATSFFNDTSYEDR